MGREWFGIDRLRLDKFYMLIKKSIKSLLLYISNQQWNTEFLETASSFMIEILLDSQYPDGLKLYFSENILSILKDVCSNSENVITPTGFSMTLKPFFTLYGHSTKASILRNLKQEVMDPLMTAKFTDSQEKPIKIPYTELADDLCKLGAEKDILTPNRKQLFQYTDIYRELAKEQDEESKKKKKTKRKKKTVGKSDDGENIVKKKKAKIEESNCEENLTEVETQSSGIESEVGTADETTVKTIDKKVKKKKTKKVKSASASTSASIAEEEEGQTNIEEVTAAKSEPSNTTVDSDAPKSVTKKRKGKKSKVVVSEEPAEITSSDVTTTQDQTTAVSEDVDMKGADVSQAEMAPSTKKSNKKKKVKSKPVEKNNVVQPLVVEVNGESLHEEVSEEIDDVKKTLDFTSIAMASEDADLATDNDKKTKKKKKRASMPGKEIMKTPEENSTTNGADQKKKVKKVRKSLPAKLQSDTDNEKTTLEESKTVQLKEEQPTLNLISETGKGTAQKKKKKNKGLSVEDAPKPFVEFLPADTPKAFARKPKIVKSEPRIMAKESKVKKTIKTPKTEIKRKSIIIDLSKNKSIGCKELKFSPLPAFDPNLKPSKGLLKVRSRAKSSTVDFS